MMFRCHVVVRYRGELDEFNERCDRIRYMVKRLYPSLVSFSFDTDEEQLERLSDIYDEFDVRSLVYYAKVDGLTHLERKVLEDALCDQGLHIIYPVEKPVADYVERFCKALDGLDKFVASTNYLTAHRIRLVFNTLTDANGIQVYLKHLRERCCCSD